LAVNYRRANSRDEVRNNGEFKITKFKLAGSEFLILYNATGWVDRRKGGWMGRSKDGKREGPTD